MSVEEFADHLVTLSVTDLIELKKVLKEKYNLEMEAPAAVAIVEEKPEPIVEKTEFKIVLTGVSPISSEKLNSVKIINKLLNIGLQPSMALTKELPSVIMEKASKLEAETFKTEMGALNATVELQ